LGNRVRRLSDDASDLRKQIIRACEKVCLKYLGRAGHLGKDCQLILHIERRWEDYQVVFPTVRCAGGFGDGSRFGFKAANIQNCTAGTDLSRVISNAKNTKKGIAQREPLSHPPSRPESVLVLYSLCRTSDIIIWCNKPAGDLIHSREVSPPMSKTTQELARSLLPKLEVLAHVQYLLEHSTPKPDGVLVSLADESLKKMMALVRVELPEG
jgi:hypothetical protein